VSTVLRARGRTTDSCQPAQCRSALSKNFLCVGRSSRILQEIELNIIRHEKCNQILKDIMGNIFTLVQEGGVCGYNEKGGDACQVSSWVPCHSAPLSSRQMSLSPRHWGLGCVPDPPFTVVQANGMSGQATTAPELA
jgi:hypothetical protein